MLKQWKKKFIETLEETGNVGSACAAAGVSRATAYKARERYNKFAHEWNDAIDIATSALEDIANERARRDNGMLKFLLQARRPAVYKPSLRSLIEKDVTRVDIENMTETEAEDFMDRMKTGRYLYYYQPGELQKLIDKAVDERLRKDAGQRSAAPQTVHRDPLADKLGYGSDTTAEQT
ncbi:MAG TPA: hypothetical protein VFA55_09680 [Candidatus Kapabacteria bacterium]|nr:hypothetical protein [Candidatus Kapabacteria bacterium]